MKSDDYKGAPRHQMLARYEADLIRLEQKLEAQNKYIQELLNCNRRLADKAVEAKGLIGCRTHPRYKGLRKPTADCEDCRQIWAARPPWT